MVLSSRKKVVYSGVLLLFAVLILNGVSYVALLVLEKASNTGFRPVVKTKLYPLQKKGLEDLLSSRTHFYKFDPDLGFSVQPNGRSGLYTANKDGIRSNRDYASQPPDGITRINTYGDSYTFGIEVKNEETWQSRLEELNPKIEALNFGVGGYGVDQAYLAFLKTFDRFPADVVVIGLMPENIKRHVNTYRAFYAPESSLPPKPRFALDKAENLKLIPPATRTAEDLEKLAASDPATLQALGASDFWYQHYHYAEGAPDFFALSRFAKYLIHHLSPNFFMEKGVAPPFLNGTYNTESEAYKVTEKLILRFQEDVKQKGATPIVFIYPHKHDVTGWREKKTKSYVPLLEKLEKEGIEYVDLMDLFDTELKSQDIKALFMPQSHYSAVTNKALAEKINRYLSETK